MFWFLSKKINGTNRKDLHYIHLFECIVYLCCKNKGNMEKTNKNLNRIKVILAEKNLQNKWLAEKVGRDQATVSKWATNSTQPSLDMLIKIAKVLEVELTDLVRIPKDE